MIPALAPFYLEKSDRFNFERFCFLFHCMRNNSNTVTVQDIMYMMLLAKHVQLRPACTVKITTNTHTRTHKLPVIQEAGHVFP